MPAIWRLGAGDGVNQLAKSKGKSLPAGGGEEMEVVLSVACVISAFHLQDSVTIV